MSSSQLINNAPQEQIVDIDLKVTAKRKFRINGDDNKIIELNTSDTLFVSRLQNAIPKLEKLLSEAQNKAQEQEDDESMDFINIIEAVDKEMREQVDYIFDSPISDVLADGSMLDVFDGKFRFEYIITELINLYDARYKDEFSKMQKEMEKHTAKYKKELV